MNESLFLNGKIVEVDRVFEGSVLVRNGKIVEVKPGQSSASAKDFAGFKGKIFDLKGKYLLPGLIDVHVHFRTPGLTKKEDWLTGSKAALAGGVTTVFDMPNTKPPTIDAKSLAQKRALVARKALINYGFYVGATPENLQEIKKMKDKDVVGVKIFMGSSTGNLLLDHKEDLEKFLKELAPSTSQNTSKSAFKSGKLIAVHAESEACIRQNLQKYPDHAEVDADPRLHSRIRAVECAHEAVKEVLHLARKYNARVHLCHVSSEKELEVIRKFKGPNVSVEVTPHHLFLTDQDYETYGNLVKVNPPLRAPADQAALWEGIRSGLIDMVASDHAPHLLEEKKLPYDQAPSGVPGVQTILPLLLNAVNEGRLTLSKVVELTSFNPAQKFGLTTKGQIAQDCDADLTVVDLDLYEKVCHHYLWTKVDWSPFHGWWLKGWPVMTFVQGDVRYEWRDRFGLSLK